MLVIQLSGVLQTYSKVGAGNPVEVLVFLCDFGEGHKKVNNDCFIKYLINYDSHSLQIHV